MSYMTEIGEVLGKQLMKFVTLNRYQLAGQVANLAFWCDELQHCLSVIDGYRTRFTRHEDRGDEACGRTSDDRIHIGPR